MRKERRGCLDPGTAFGYSHVFRRGQGNQALLEESELSRCAKIKALYEIQGNHNRRQDDSEKANGGDSQSQHDDTASKL